MFIHIGPCVTTGVGVGGKYISIKCTEKKIQSATPQPAQLCFATDTHHMPIDCSNFILSSALNAQGSWNPSQVSYLFPMSPGSLVAIHKLSPTFRAGLGKLP